MSLKSDDRSHNQKNDLKLCQARHPNGRRCERHALQDSDPALCFEHQGWVGPPDIDLRGRMKPRGFYGRRYTPEEVAQLVTLMAANDQDGLSQEIDLARVFIKRLLEEID